ncbi:MAG: alpha-E domain-containing protein [Pseudomonadota bacterium]
MLLSRHAENAFWLGRYTERVESISRLLNVTEAFAADQDSNDAWAPILSVFSDEKAFAETGKKFEAANVARFYLTDRNNPNSAAFALFMAKENARALRHLISTEAWRQMSVFFDLIASVQKRRFAVSKLSEICTAIREGSYTFRGVMAASGYRDEVWRFYELGAALERADQTTRLIDIKYFRFDRDDDDAAAPPDVTWWNTLLRSASGYHAFQRRHSFNADPEDAARFILFDPFLPHSVYHAAMTGFYGLERLERDFRARPDAGVAAAEEALRARIDNPPAHLRGRGLHRYIDALQREINTLANAINERYLSPAG